MDIRQLVLRITGILGCLIAAAAAFAQPPAVRYTFSHPQMGTMIRLVFYSTADSAGARSVAERVFVRIDSLNAAFSDYLPESELNRLCDRAGDGEKIIVSKELWDILKMSATYSEMTNGAFDVTVGAVTRLWRKARMMKELPDSSRLAAAVATVDYRYVRLFKKRRAMIAQKGTRLDLGGIAQGYTADECLRMLRAAGIPNALVDVGGDIALGEPPPAAKGWIIEYPVAGENGSVTADTLILSNCGITTSGAGYRYLEINGVRYSHIIDPRTGQGLTHRNWVTVKAPTATDADAWATALSVLGKQGWDKLKSKYPDITGWIRQAPF
ncbi:MAG TPA: FAD:protein FMN transferase [Saprospiraceae bacterium]|nr:FAD:protein FMN transferase [Saprospiraceae bacterium]